MIWFELFEKDENGEKKNYKGCNCNCREGGGTDGGKWTSGSRCARVLHRPVRNGAVFSTFSKRHRCLVLMDFPSSTCPFFCRAIVHVGKLIWVVGLGLARCFKGFWDQLLHQDHLL